MNAVQCTKFQVLITLFRSHNPVVIVVGNATNIDAGLLKQLSSMYETGISIKDISEQLRMDQTTVKRLLRLLGYAAAD
jgi:DNA-binding MarR family transcriptional regulator